MSYPVRADIVPLLRRLSYLLYVVAKAHSVNFQFESSLDKKEFYFHEEILISDLTHLCCRIIADSPQGCAVTLIVLPSEWPYADGVRIQIRQTCACSFSPKNIQADIHHQFLLSYPPDGGALFELDVYAQKLGEKEDDGVFLEKVNNLIHLHLDKEHFDVPALHQALGISRNQLYRRLKPLVKMPPKRYILFVRLTKAREYLETRNWTIGEVAFRLGFLDESHFIRVFKKHFGCTPRQARSGFLSTQD